MAKALTAIDRQAGKIVVDGIKTLLATYQQTKLAGDVGTRTTWSDMERILIRAALRQNRKGNTGFQGDVSNIGQTP